MRGRLSKPTALKILEGKRGHRPLPQNEPQPALGAVAPTWMSLGARKEWGLLAPVLERMGVLTEADGETLAELCEAKATHKANLKEGRFSTELWRAIQAQEARFGLSPSDRARLSVSPQKPKNKLERFLGGR